MNTLSFVSLALMLVALASAQYFEPIWPTNQELDLLPQIYTAGYLQNCLAAGLTGGCSACVHGSQGACSWLAISEPGLATNDPSEAPFGGVRGVCAPKNIEQYRTFVLGYYSRVASSIYDTPYTYSASSVIAVRDRFCPANSTKELPFRGYGISIPDSTVVSTTFESEFCEFPSQDGKWVIDRTAGALLFAGVFGKKRDVSQNNVVNEISKRFCTFANNAEHDLRAIRLLGGDSDYLSSGFSLKEFLDGNNGISLFDPRFAQDLSLAQLHECFALDQASLCTSVCPEYGKTYGVLFCPEALEYFRSACGPFFGVPNKKRALTRPSNPNDLGIRGLGLLFFLGLGQGATLDIDDYRQQYDALVADWKSRGYEPKCYDPFRVKASKRWSGASGLLDACNKLGQPYVDTCDGECIVTYYDSNNCGRCGNMCPQGQRCFKGVCQINNP